MWIDDAKGLNLGSKFLLGCIPWRISGQTGSDQTTGVETESREIRDNHS